MSGLGVEVRERPRLPARPIAVAIRRAAGISQARLAQELGVHRGTVARWELGIRHPRGARLAAYAALLDELREATR